MAPPVRGHSERHPRTSAVPPEQGAPTLTSEMVSEGNGQALMCQANNTALQGKSFWEVEDECLATIKGVSPCQPAAIHGGAQK